MTSFNCFVGFLFEEWRMSCGSWPLHSTELKRAVEVSAHTCHVIFQELASTVGHGGNQGMRSNFSVGRERIPRLSQQGSRPLRLIG